MTELLEFLIQKITAATPGDDFEVNSHNEDGKTVMEILAKPDIVGLIIGREGKTIKNIRKLLSVRAVLEHQSVTISVNAKE
jgi:uncharacterized protein